MPLFVAIVIPPLAKRLAATALTTAALTLINRIANDAYDAAKGKDKKRDD